MENFKAWIWTDGKEIIFPFNNDHEQMVSDRDVEKSVYEGCIRITIYKNKMAVHIKEVSEDVVYRVSKFFRTRKITSGEFYIETLTNQTFKLSSISELQKLLQTV